MAFHTSVANKTFCRSFCYSMTGCSYYTYHTLSDPDYPGACFLLSALQSPVRACSDCQTGVMDCSRKCFFLGEKDEITYGGVEITDSHQYTNLRLVALGNCLLVAVMLVVLLVVGVEAVVPHRAVVEVVALWSGNLKTSPAPLSSRSLSQEGVSRQVLQPMGPPS